MPTYQSFAADVRRLDRAIRALEPRAAAAGVTPPAGQEWFDLLKNKLLAQIDLPATPPQARRAFQNNP